jgi:hypothetical protein
MYPSDTSRSVSEMLQAAYEDRTYYGTSLEMFDRAVLWFLWLDTRHDTPDRYDRVRYSALLRCIDIVLELQLKS